jgi:hypothetical protein
MGDPKFSLGRTVITVAAQATLHPEDVPIALHRHITGDWGELDTPDKQANDDALLQNLRLLSRYRDRQGHAFYVITEHDRSVTTVLLPEDY